MKRLLFVLMCGVLLVSGCSKTKTPAPAPTTKAPVTSAPATTPPVVPSIAPSVTPSVKTSSSFPPLEIDSAFLGAMRQSGPVGNPDYAIWRQVPDKTLTDLGHNVARLFASYNGTIACVNTNSLDWGKDASTDDCEEALRQTVLFLDNSSASNGLETTHSGNQYLVGAATAAYLQ